MRNPVGIGGRPVEHPGIKVNQMGRKNRMVEPFG
jgi:hypothetical protein